VASGELITSCTKSFKMVKLTMDLIARGTSGYTKKKRDESMQHYLKRLTHLYLEDRNIDEIVSTYTVLIACFAILIFLD